MQRAFTSSVIVKVDIPTVNKVVKKGKEGKERVKDVREKQRCDHFAKMRIMAKQLKDLPRVTESESEEK